MFRAPSSRASFLRRFRLTVSLSLLLAAVASTGCAGGGGRGGGAARLSILEPAASVDVQRGGLLDIRWTIAGAVALEEVGFLLDVDGDSTTTIDQHLIGTVTAVAPGSSTLSTFAVEGVPDGAFRLIASGRWTTGGTVVTLAPGAIAVIDGSWGAFAGGPDEDAGDGVATHDDGSILWIGQMGEEATFAVGQPEQSSLFMPFPSFGGWLASYSTAGRLRWARIVEGLRHGGDARVIAVDGGWVASGSFDRQLVLDRGLATEARLDAAPDTDNHFVLRLTDDGHVQWLRHFQTAMSPWTLGEAPLSLDRADNGGVICTGSFGGRLTLCHGELDAQTLFGPPLLVRNSFTIRLDALGRIGWVRQEGSGGDVVSTAIAVAQDGSCFVTGIFSGRVVFGRGTAAETPLETAPFDDDIFVIHYAADGSMLWATRLGDTELEMAFAVISTADAGCFVAGSFSDWTRIGTIPLASLGGAEDGFVARLDAHGGVVWARSFGGSEGVHPVGLVALADGSFAVGGYFRHEVIFGAGYAVRRMLVDPDDGGFVARFAADGSLHWAVRAGDLMINALSSGPQGIVVSSVYAGWAQVGPGRAFPSLGDEDAGLLRLNPDGSF